MDFLAFLMLSSKFSLVRFTPVLRFIIAYTFSMMFRSGLYGAIRWSEYDFQLKTLLWFLLFEQSNCLLRASNEKLHNPWSSFGQERTYKFWLVWQGTFYYTKITVRLNDSPIHNRKTGKKSSKQYTVAYNAHHVDAKLEYVRLCSGQNGLRLRK